jgi:hypothetical protein
MIERKTVHVAPECYPKHLQRVARDQAAANKRHSPGIPLRVWSPRSLNMRPAPATRSFTVLDTSVSPPVAAAATTSGLFEGHTLKVATALDEFGQAEFTFLPRVHRPEQPAGIESARRYDHCHSILRAFGQQNRR